MYVYIQGVSPGLTCNDISRGNRDYPILFFYEHSWTKAIFLDKTRTTEIN